ncbi:hypothetical protein WKK05_23175 [Nostoc sp. UHCC 0302]|uniref:hypothetical protein n=1 Tax=Nostoc sp. UHCC 0302 TaxID=3134896 RepID=UPI00311C9A40
MAEEKKEKSDNQGTTASGGYQTTLEEINRKTGDAEATDARPTATPESPENDSVPGSPNQGTESR